jgi:hypothetical protein
MPPHAHHLTCVWQLDRERQRTERERNALEDVLRARDRMNDEVLKEKTSAKEALLELDRVREALEREKQASQEMTRERERMRDDLESLTMTSRSCICPPENSTHCIHMLFLPMCPGNVCAIPARHVLHQLLRSVVQCVSRSRD